MADNDNSGTEGKGNGDQLNRSSFLDSSTAARAYEVCTGPVTDGERAYLIRHGLAMEDSRGELYGEPSTIIDSENSNCSIYANTPSPAKQNQSENLPSGRSARKSRASMVSMKTNADSFDFPPTPISTIENQMSKLVLQEHNHNQVACEMVGEDKSFAGRDVGTPLSHLPSGISGIASTMYSPITPVDTITPRRRGNKSSTPLSAVHISQSCRVTRASVKRITELRELLSTSNVQDHPDSLLQEQQNIQDQEYEEEEIEDGECDPSLSDTIPVPADALYEKEQHDSFKGLDRGQDVEEEAENTDSSSKAADVHAEVISDGVKDLDSGTSSLAMENANVSMQMKESGELDVSTLSLPEVKTATFSQEEKNESLIAFETLERRVENETATPQNVTTNEAVPPQFSPSKSNVNISMDMNKQVAEVALAVNSNFEDISSCIFESSVNSSSTSSGGEFDDTITRMEKMLAMAEEQELISKADEVEAGSLQSSSPATAKVSKTPNKEANKSCNGATEKQTRGSLQPSSASRRTPTLTKPPTPVRMGKHTPSTLQQTPGGNSGSGSKTNTPLPIPSRVSIVSSGRRSVSASSTHETPERRANGPKTPQPQHGLKTTFSPKLHPNPEAVKTPPCRSAKTPVGSEQKASPLVNQKPNTGKRMADFKQPALPSPQFQRAKKYFESPARNLLGAQITNKDFNSASTPIRPFTQPQAIQDTLVSPVSTIYPSPVVVKPRPRSPVKPVPLPVKLLKDNDKMTSPSDLLKKNNKKGTTVINSPVAAYIYSTPTPPRVHRVIKTTDNSNEKKGPVKPLGGGNGSVAKTMPRNARISGIPRLAAFAGTGTGGTGGSGFNANSTRILKDFGQNQQKNWNISPAPRLSNADLGQSKLRFMRPVQYEGSDKIREKICNFDIPDGRDDKVKEDSMKIQVHKGFVDENTNATVLEDLSMHKAFIPVRVKEVRDFKND